MIELEKVYKDGKFLGTRGVMKVDLTPEFLAKIRADKDDKMGWKRDRKVMKEAGYDIDD